LIYVRQALRSLTTNPGVALSSVVTVALGLGIGTAMFEIFESVLLRPLPYRDAGGLVEVLAAYPSFDSYVSHKDFESLREGGAFRGIALTHGPKELDFAGLGATQSSVPTMAVSKEFFDLMGTPTQIGRTISAADVESNSKVALLSYPFWHRLGASPDAIGRTVRLDDRLYTVIGVMPPGFELLYGSSLWVPLLPEDTKGHGHDSRIVARLRGDLTPGQLEAQLDAVSAALSGTNLPYSYRYKMRSVRETIAGKHRPLLLILAGSVLFVFLLACSNVSHLFLARHTKRRAEFAVRIALGAGRLDLLLPVLGESAFICSCGLAFGLFLSHWIRRAAQGLIPVELPRLDQAGLNIETLMFAVGLTVLSVFVVFALPAFEIFRQEPLSVIKGAASGEQSGPSGGFSRRAALLMVNSALAMVLSVGALLLLQSLVGLLAIDVGFSPSRLFTAEVSLPAKQYDAGPRTVVAFQEILRRVGSLGGISHAAISDRVPFGGTGVSVEIETKTNTGDSRQRFVNFERVSLGLSGVYGIPLVAGRDFEPTDVAGRSRVALVNQTLARMFWPSETAIGKRFRGGFGTKDELTEVVGVVGDMRSVKLETPPVPTVYVPFTQAPSNSMFVVARSSLPAGALTSAVEGAVQAGDRSLRIENVRTGNDLLSKSLRQPEFLSGLLTAFSALALLLSAVGVYGVISYWVEQSTREIGVRIALGARPFGVVRMVIGRTLRTVGVGLVAGLIIALVVVQVLNSVLYGVQPRNPVALSLGALVVAVVTVVAAAGPALRAASLDPMIALRHD
jgi:predicted permease